jgi:hypothetical protein
VLLQIPDIGIARQKPQQLMNDGFQMQLFGRNEGKTLTERKPHLMTKNRQCSGPSAVVFLDPTAEDEFHQVKILTHLFGISAATRRWASLSPGATVRSDFSTAQMPTPTLNS